MTVSALSYNVLYDGLEDEAAPWSERVADVAALIRFHRPTVVGLQECWLGQADDLRMALPSYQWYGEDRDVGEHTPVGVLRERARIVDGETFWLAPDPTDRHRAWDANIPRLATHATIELQESGRRIEHYNVHLDVDGPRARRESARILRDRAEGHDAPVILTGDCNSRPDSRSYEILTEAVDDARRVVESPHGPFETYHGYDRAASKRIDYVFGGEGLTPTAHGVLTDMGPDWLAPSDHWPVMARFAVADRE
ncbi:endonuclease/exonuclease/phosphatase family protein [Halomicrobium salinisoli]|uniref:endonuclease/exonuclease/phosphatase family protein n=1 Tax=Halomicrobium salinisoli TaxID=2878391 RepID=UPI001CEFB2A5|nr:endonuclease/exonuclease/phosphatase family protein [Halomicrobium salinisoli]